MFLTAQENYLTLYKSYETALRDLGRDPRQVETDFETSDPSRAARLRMCRLFRNYLSHENDPGFLSPSDKMLAFLSQEVFDLKIQNDSVKQHLKPAGNYIFEDSVKCSDVLTKLGSTKALIVVRHSKSGYDLCNWYDILTAYLASKPAKLAVVKAIRQKPVFVQPVDKFSELDSSRVTICTSDGTPDGRLIGFVKLI